MEAYWDLIARIIEESDIILEILDARAIELSRNKKVEEMVKEANKPFIFVINKSDLVRKKLLKKQLTSLKKEGHVVFVSAKNRRSIRILLYEIKKVFRKEAKKLKQLKATQPDDEKQPTKEKKRPAKGKIIVGVLGYPNVGKSSIINALSFRKKVKVSKKAGTTHGIHWVKATNEIKLIDSPGVIPFDDTDEIKHGLIGAKDSEQLKNPEVVALAVIQMFLKNNKKKLEEHYGIKIKEEDPHSILEKICIKKRHLSKGGSPDLHRTSTMIVREWQQGKIIF